MGICDIFMVGTWMTTMWPTQKYNPFLAWNFVTGTVTCMHVNSYKVIIKKAMDAAIHFKGLVAYTAWRIMQEWTTSTMKDETIHLLSCECYNQEN